MVNEKKLLEEMLTIEAGFKVLLSQFHEVKKQLNIPQERPTKMSARKERLQRILINKERARQRKYSIQN